VAVARRSEAKRRSDEDGQVELVIVFPVAMLLILLLIQGALWFLARSVATDAAQDGARAASVIGGTEASGQQAATADLHQLAGPMLSATTVSATRSASNAQVTVTGRAESILPGFSLPISTSASDPVEVFRP
jgi:Flp pilus assembly protein TadG